MKHNITFLSSEAQPLGSAGNDRRFYALPVPPAPAEAATDIGAGADNPAQPLLRRIMAWLYTPAFGLVVLLAGGCCTTALLWHIVARLLATRI